MGSIQVMGVSKRYRYRKHGGPARVTPEGDTRFDARGKDFWALQDVDLQVRGGSIVGIVGPNGAGKSTLLRMIGGVGRPTTGKIRADGQIGAMLELGTDFHPELTGRENVVLGGIIAGLTRRQVLERMDDIIDFAELREFIDTPVRAYSSGMLLRLAFSIVVNTNPEILLIDEVLAVGDQTFRAKCLSRVEDFRRAGCAILLVTHDTRLAAQVCDVVMWLSKGRSVMVGPGQKVVAAYEESMNWETKRRTPADWRDEVSSSGIELRMMDNRFGSMEVQITDVRLIDPRGHRSQRVHPGEGLRVEVDYWCERPQPAPNFGVIIRQENNTVLFDATMPASELGLEAIQGNGSVAITFDRLDLNSGEYHIDVGIYRQDWAYAYDYHWRAYPLMVVAANLVKGAVNPPHAWERSVPRSARVR